MTLTCKCSVNTLCSICATSIILVVIKFSLFLYWKQAVYQQTNLQTCFKTAPLFVSDNG